MSTKAPKRVLDNLGISSQREFKSLKRKQLKAVIKAFDVYGLGCAYCPGYPKEVFQIYSALDSLKKQQSVKEWGR